MTINTPVLLLGFNRPALMEVVLGRLREVQPRALYVAIDGPRPGNAEDIKKVQACQDLVLTIDWPCEVHTLFQDRNLGCGLGVSTAISWFFTQVEHGIILEDDIVPDPSFFAFCAELLDRYENDERVFAISGCNVVPQCEITSPEMPYRFSRIPLVWGWATWRRSWELHELDISNWRRKLPLRRLFRRFGLSPNLAAFWATEFELTGRGNIDTWDWQLTCAALSADQLTATTNINLVENIGFGSQATHTIENYSPLDAASSISLPTSPVPVIPDAQADTWATMHHFGGGMLTTVDRWRQYLQAGKPVVAPWL
jgi:hypothetical protein